MSSKRNDDDRADEATRTPSVVASKSEPSSGSGDGFPRPFGPYVLLGTFGKGGMGEVYLARRAAIEGIEKLCVLKLLRADLANEKEYVGRFLDEARVVIGLQHANICPVFDVGRVGDALYLAMEYLQGVNLRHVADRLAERDRRLTPELAVHIVSATLAALDHAHRHEDPSTGVPLLVVHRDVSPHNVMITFQGEVKLIDFGLAASSVKREETESQLVMGKVAYMSPEQARGDPVDARTDQYATAIVLYELLTGERFYGSRKTHEIWQVVGPGGYVPDKLATLDDELRGILGRALAEKAEQRFATCEDFREALVGWLSRRGPILSERKLREFMHDVFVDEIDAQRAMAQRLLARDRALKEGQGEPTASSGPTATGMLQKGQWPRAMALDDDPFTVPMRGAETVSEKPRPSDAALPLGLSLTERDHESGTEATLSSAKVAFPVKAEAAPRRAALVVAAGAAMVALALFVVLDGRGGVALSTTDATTAVVETPTTPVIGGGPSATDATDAVDDAPPPSDQAGGLDAGAGTGSVVADDASSGDAVVDHAGRPPATGGVEPAPDEHALASADVDEARAPRRVVPPTRMEPPALFTPTPPAAPAIVHTPSDDASPSTTDAPQKPASADTAPPATAPPATQVESLDALYARLERCPSDCAKRVLATRSLAELKTATPDVVDAFRLVSGRCLPACPR